ncbi:RNA polymerase II C-terminal domain phosphatase-like 2 isoform X2 [Andrographis paniculata]|uniref:RNA polymerase II C-terminal domain phosphatase-like 2 isoform X2 n=1 Tax=Andrographis paniculata TaxID=175694 RepID=UPI0021E8BCA5|nr:RNA polymerase II C-terminal domain phosphatase-like 2 isoform X2 [Andrographis paniculata]
MSRLGFKCAVYHGELHLGELEMVTVKDRNFQFPNNEIRIHHITPKSERCYPLSVLHTISCASATCKLEPASDSDPSSDPEQSPLINLHASCFYELKSFEDRIETLMGWLGRETDPIRESGMTAEMKRYVEDRALLKQYSETDFVSDGSKTYQVQMEDVPLLSDGIHQVVRPVVRLPEKNIILTRINPENRDTSVLVRLRPAWEDLKNYLTARGRKRFEVFVCTMAERDYALEMWRLLDPEAHLISPKQLLDRVVCVKPGARKSLNHVFQSGNCHPKMAMVIDDRLKVWDDKDQPRVHVVPAFSPYYAPQAEIASAVPVLCVARNVACNVRGGFFKEFDENLLQKVPDIFYEDEVSGVPCPPDVSNYLISEDASFIPNGIPNVPIAEGMHGPEVAQRLQSMEEKNALSTVSHPMANNIELKPASSKLPVTSVVNATGPPSSGLVLPSEKPSLLGDPPRREIRYTASTEKPLLSKLPRHTLQQRSWLVDESSRGIISRTPGMISELDPLDRHKGRQNSLNHAPSTSVSTEFHESQMKKEEAKSGYDIQKQILLPPNQGAVVELSMAIPNNHSLSTNKDLKIEADKMNQLPSLSIGVLQEIGRRCKSKVEFRSVVSTSDDLQFSVEVYFTGEKIGVGMGKTRKDAQQQAAENALRSLADSYIAYVESCSTITGNNFDKLFLEKENGFLWDIEQPKSEEPLVSNGFPKKNASEVGTPENTPHG